MFKEIRPGSWLENANYSLCERLGSAKRRMTPKDSLADTVKTRRDSS